MQRKKIISLQSLPIFLVIFCCSACLPLSPQEDMAWPRWAPDGQRVVYECYLEGPTAGGGCSLIDRLVEHPDYCQPSYTAAAADICTISIDGNQRIRLTQDPGGDWRPVWSPDGSQIAYKRQDGIYLMDTDGQNKRRLVSASLDLPTLANDEVSITWSPDGSQLLFAACLDRYNYDIYLIDLDDDTLTILTPNSNQHEIRPSWIANGSKIFFLSTEASSWGNCELNRDAPHEMKVINADGSDEQVIYDQKLYYGSIAVSNEGQIAFVSDLVSTKEADYYEGVGEAVRVYKIELTNTEPVEIINEPNIARLLGAWSPDGKYLPYIDSITIHVLNLETGEIREVPEITTATSDISLPPDSQISWSPDGQEMAIIGWSDDVSHNDLYIFDLADDMVRRIRQK